MKKIIILLCSVVLILLCIPFTGCGTPRIYEIEWYFDNYLAEGNYYRGVGFDYYDHFGSLFSDCAEISFKDDGGFYFKDVDGEEYEGTYKCKKGIYDTAVTLIFPDGSKAEGYYWNYDADDIKYSLHFEISGTSYNFDDKKRSFDADSLCRCLKKLTAAICTFAADGRMEIEDYPYYENLKKAVIGKVGDSFVAVAGGNSYLFDNSKYWCYNFNSQKIEKSELKEGECIIRAFRGYNDFIAVYYPES